MYVPIILGTGREGAQSGKVANFLVEEAKNYGFQTELVRVEDYVESRTYRMSDGNPKAEKWNDIVSQADGFIIVVPEYNYSFPGELKIFLDSLFKEYFGKYVGLVGVSGGGFGGVRGVEHLKPVLNKFRMRMAGSSVYFSHVKDLFDEGGNITDESYKEKVKTLFEEIESFGK